jgi:hypothetical protein
MLEVIVRLEEGITGEELYQYAAYTPDIARKTPSEVEDDLWCSVVTC